MTPPFFVFEKNGSTRRIRRTTTCQIWPTR